MKFIGIIPARYGSTRFPGKPLTMIGGKTMIQRVYEQAKQALDTVWVATDDRRIWDEVDAFGGSVTMTSDKHRNGTERCAEVAKKLKLPEDTIIINIQGDQPFIPPEYIKDIMRCYELGNPDIVTLTCPLQKEQRDNPNCVKAYVTEGGWAKNFNRATFFHPDWQVFKHIGVYAYPVGVLLDLVRLEETPQERATHLEQVRWLQKYYIMCRLVLKDTISVDTPEDLIKLPQYTNTITDNIANLPKLTYIHVPEYYIVQQIFAKEATALQRIPVTDAYKQATDIIHHRVHELGGKLITSGMGKAGQVAHDIATTFSSTGTPAVFLHAAEAQHGDLGVIQKNDVLLLISNSGETRELIELYNLKNDLDPTIPTILITSHPDTFLSRQVSYCIPTGNPDEVCPLGLTPTTSTTVMTAIGDALIVLMMIRIDFTKEQYALRHHGGYIGNKLRES